MPDEVHKRQWAWMLTAIPVVYLLAMVYCYHLDAPFWDEWELVPLLEKGYAGTLTWYDFWAQQNESRVFFPKLLLYAMAYATQWTAAYEVVATLAFGLALGLAFLVQLCLTERRMQWRGTLWALPVIALLAFSLNQWRNWMWGFELHIVMPAACVAWTVVLLSDPTFRWRRFAVAALLSVVAAYSVTSGVVALGAFGFMVLTAPAPQTRMHILRMLAWASVAALAAAVYLYGYETTPSNHSPYVMLQHPVGYVHYVLVYLGAPMANFSTEAALFFGIAGISSSICISALLLRRRQGHALWLRPYWGMQVFALGVAALTGIKQAGEGPQQALSSRYMTWSTFFWVGLVCVLYGLLLVTREPNPAMPYVRRAARCGAAVLVVFAILSTAWGGYCADERHDAFCIGRDALLNGGDEADYIFLYPRPAFVREKRPFLLEHRLSIFKQDAQPHSAAP